MADVKDLQKEIGIAVQKAAQQNLGTTQTRFKIKAKWKNGRPISYSRTAYKGRIDNSGALRKSITYETTETGIKWSMLSYGEYVEEGRKGLRYNKHLLGKGGKGIPVGALRKWIASKPVRLQTGKGFAKQTDKALEQASFLINRKIKWFGIDATRFFSEPFYEKTKDYLKRFQDAYMNEQIDVMIQRTNK